MPDVLPWSPDDAVLDRVCQSLRAGHVVALPTEAGYEGVASALDSQAVAGLAMVAAPSEPLAIVLGDALEVFDWLPYLRGAGLRLARAFWPGPLTLAAHSAAAGLSRALPDESAHYLVRQGQIAVRIPDQDWPGPLLRRLAGPLVSAPLPGFPHDPGAIDRASARFALIVDAGASPLTQPPTLVRVLGKSATIVRPGAVPGPHIDSVLACRITFVCAGNTCRSPLAEALCKKLLCDTLACGPGDLAQRGYLVQSAGMSAALGNPAAAEAIATAQGHGADLAGHRSHPLTPDLLSQSDFVFTMTWSQCQLLRSLRLAAPVAQLLDPAGADVDDPIGGSDVVYQECAQQIGRCLAQRLPELLES